jgi:hypothetical protein
MFSPPAITMNATIAISVPRCAKKKRAIRERGLTGEGMLGT